MVTDNFLTARTHPKQGEAYSRLSAKFGAPWTPTVLLLDPDGVERHRIEGFLPPDEFLANLTLGLGHLAFQAGRWEEAENRFQSVVEKFANTDAAPEAQYWAGVSRYKATGDAGELQKIAAAFDKKYRDSIWSKKASVWKQQAA